MKALNFGVATADLSRFVAMGLCLLASLACLTVRAVEFELIPRNPTPSDPIQIRVTETPPGCPGEFRGSRTGFVLYFSLVIDLMTPPGGRSCEATAFVGALPQGRYAIEYTNFLTNKYTTQAFDVAPGGVGGFVNYPIPASSLGSLVATVILLGAAGVFSIRRRSRLAVGRTSSFILALCLSALVLPAVAAAGDEQKPPLPSEDDLVDRQLIVLLDPRETTVEASDLVGRLARGDASDDFVKILGKPTVVSKVVREDAPKVQDRIRQLKEIAPLSPERLLSQYLVLTYEKGDDIAAIHEAALKDKRFLSVARNFRLYNSAWNDPYFPLPANPTTIPGMYQWGMVELKAQTGWDLSTGRAFVGIMDRGVWAAHPDLVDNLRPHLSRGFISTQGTIVETTDIEEELYFFGSNSFRGHGTHVTGIVAARGNNLQGTVGMCPTCSAQMFRLQSYDAVSLMKGVARAVASGVQVLNMSFGAGSYDINGACQPPQVHSPTCSPTTPDGYCMAMQHATSRGVLLIASAGNCGRAEVDFPANYTNHVVSVGATQRDDYLHLGNRLWNNALGGSSNRSAGQNLVAPGKDVISTFYSAFPDQWNSSCGNRTETFESTATPGSSHFTDTGYGDCTGTSMAAPHVAGIAGLLYSANPTAPPEAIRGFLTTTTDRSQAGSGYDPLGLVGWGVPDAGKAVQAALGPPGTVNRLSPLFGFYSSSAVDHFYTSWPQMSAAAVDGTMPPHAVVSGAAQNQTYEPRGGLLGAYLFPGNPCSTEQTGAACSVQTLPSAKARVAVFTTHVNPYDAATPLLPLYRMSYACPAAGAACSNPYHVSHAYATSWPNSYFQNRGYVLDGIEGYVVPPSSTQPPSSVKLCRRLDTTRDDWVLYPSVAGSCATVPAEVLADGGTYSATGTGTETSEWLGYVFPTVDDGDYDNDGLTITGELAEGRNPLAKDNDIFGVNRLFGRQQYRDFLGREGEESGIAYYAGLLQAGSISRPQIIINFFNSPEFQGTVAPLVRLYLAYFLRVPDYPGLIFHLTNARNGMPLSATSQAFSLSPEFMNTYGNLNNTQYVNLLYQNIFSRVPAQSEVDYWLNKMAQGYTRGDVMVGFSESPENKALVANKVFVIMTYVGMMRRSPDPGGYVFWSNYLDQGQSGLSLVNAFYTSAEYHNRFLP